MQKLKFYICYYNYSEQFRKTTHKMFLNREQAEAYRLERKNPNVYRIVEMIENG
jgi:hypothetical protein